MLARMLKRHPCELRADFQETYALCIDCMGRSSFFGLRGAHGGERLSVLYAADLCTQLQQGSRTLAAEDSRLAWTNKEYLLAFIENHLAVWLWGNSDEKKRPKDPPAPYLPYTKDGEEKDEESFDVGNYQQELDRLREVIKHGNRTCECVRDAHPVP